MRTIKFRAWDTALNQMLSWEYICKPEPFIMHRYFMDDDVDLMQFTGLLDKNGKEIYEGDLVKGEMTYSEPKVQKVQWDRGFTGFAPFNDYDTDCQEYYDTDGCEVIGNIYENPELKEAQQ
jgi:uncharacterized phage protein (TIGR01671 family)